MDTEEIEFPTLEGEKCCVAPLRQEFAEDVARHANSEGVHRFMTDQFPFPYELKHAHEWLELNKAAPKKFMNLAICVKKEGKLVYAGGIGTETTSAPIVQHTVQMGYWIGEEYWGRGIVPEAVRLMVGYIFSDFFTKHCNPGHPVLRIEAIIFAENSRSAAVLRKNGFVLEGRARRIFQKDGKLHDGLMHALLKEDHAKD